MAQPVLSGGLGQQEAPAPEPDRGATGRGLPQSGHDTHPKESWTALPEGIKRLMFAPPLSLKAQSQRRVGNASLLGVTHSGLKPCSTGALATRI